jgi:ATP-dependent Clp protease ATP-binding subunit ClpA
VVDKFLFELEAQLLEKQVTLDVDADARRWLADRGFDPQMGARPMARVIQEHVKRALADELLFGKLAEGGKVKLGARDGELLVEAEAAPKLPVVV